MQNNSHIFNITPPNCKDDDKSKGIGKYQLFKENTVNKNWKGFTASKILNVNPQDQKSKSEDSLSNQNDQKSEKMDAPIIYKHFEFDPFHKDWPFQS